jgi:hypothetical protein
MALMVLLVPAAAAAVWSRWWALLIMVGYCLGFTILAVGFMHKSFLRR